MIIGVCGFGYTGSSALFGLLKEFSKTSYVTNGEITLSYCPDGLEDLEYLLCKNPSKGVKCDIGIYRFLQLTDEFKRSYNRFTNKKFIKYSNDYISSITDVSWKAYRTFEYQRLPIKRIIFLILNKIRIFAKTKLNIDFVPFPVRKRYFSIFPNDFLVKTKEYVNNLFPSKDTCLVLNQPFSAGNPLNSMKFFENPYCIFVDRDPRDLYIMVKYAYKSWGAFIPTDTILNFIKYYKKTRDSRLYKNSDRIITIKFEELIYEYDNTINKIQKFLNNKIGDHDNKFLYFNPSVSRANTHVFKKYKEEKANIETIEKELAEYLFDFSKYDISETDVNLNQFTML